MKCSTILTAIFLLLPGFLNAGVVHPFHYDTPYSPVFYVCDAPLNMRDKPARSGAVVKQFALGEPVTLVRAGEQETIDGITAWWYRALAEDGTEGWVFGAFLASQTLELDLNTNGRKDYVFFRVHKEAEQYYFNAGEDLILYIDGRRISTDLIDRYIETPTHTSFFLNRTRDTVLILVHNEYENDGISTYDMGEPSRYFLFKLDTDGLSYVIDSYDRKGLIEDTIQSVLGHSIVRLPHLGSYIATGSYGHVEFKSITGMRNREMKTIPGGIVRQTARNEDFSQRMFNWVKPFEIGVFEVTHELWFQVMTQAEDIGYIFSGEETPGSIDNTQSGIPDESTKDQPVTSISWIEAVVWCNAYSELTGLTPVYRSNGEIIRDGTQKNVHTTLTVLWNADGYRLPTDGEWQLAASWKGLFRRTPSTWASGGRGPEPSETQRFAWFVDWFAEDYWSRQTQPVGRLSANSAGIYDMSGNVAELCYDISENLPGFFRFNYRGPQNTDVSSAQLRILRGGDIHSSADEVSIGWHDYINVHTKGGLAGFRVARSTGLHPLFFAPLVPLLLLLAVLCVLCFRLLSVKGKLNNRNNAHDNKNDFQD